MIPNQLTFRTVFLLALVACSWIEEASAAISTRYHVTDLGTLGGPISEGRAINAGGQVTGYSSVTYGAGLPHAFLWTPTSPGGASGAMIDLGTLGGEFSVGNSINAGGQVAGTAYTTEGPRHAFLYDPGAPGMHDLGTLGGSDSEALGVNAGDQVVGFAYTTAGALHAFLHDGMMHDLGTLGGTYSVAVGINTSGQVAGESTTAGDSETHAFLWTPTTPNGTSGTMLDLGTLGGTSAYGGRINDSGQLVGSSYTEDFELHAFLYDGAMHDLGTLGGTSSIALGINASGHVTGGAKTTGDAAEHAFLYTIWSGMVDLNSRIDPLSGWELTSAYAINDAGQITGTGVVGGESHAFLLTPVPERYQIAGGQFQFSSGDTWDITDGAISMELFDVLVSEEGHRRAVFGVAGFSLAAVDSLGASHTIAAIPDGLPAFHDPFVPDVVQDIGLVNVYPNGFLDMILYDLSIDGAPVDPLDTIGGPAFVGSEWIGAFPVPTNFSVSMLADLRSRNLHGQVTLLGAIVPEPGAAVLMMIGGLIAGWRWRVSVCESAD